MSILVGGTNDLDAPTPTKNYHEFVDRSASEQSRCFDLSPYRGAPLLESESRTKVVPSLVGHGVVQADLGIHWRIRPWRFLLVGWTLHYRYRHYSVGRLDADADGDDYNDDYCYHYYSHRSSYDNPRILLQTPLRNRLCNLQTSR